MRRSWVWLSLLVWICLAPYHAAAIDCQNPQRDELAICRDRELGAVEARRVALFESMLAARPEAERQAFSSYERRWDRDLCPDRADGVDWRCLRHAIEDHVADLQSLDGLRFVSRERPDNDRGDHPKLDVHATWVEFTAPQARGEQLFNEMVREKVGRLPFADAYDPKTVYTLQDTLDIKGIYRSSALISATLASWHCCGIHGAGGDEAINVDLLNGTAFAPENWFFLDEVAAACWVQFVSHEFRQQYPLQEAIAKFSADLKQQERWSFSRRGVDLQFYALMNYSGGNYVCRLRNDQLARLSLWGRFPP